MERGLQVPGRVPYTYSPLKVGEVRILRLLPGNLLRCEMLHIDLEHAPRYTALSYTWDDEPYVRPKVRNLVVDGAALPVEKNLYVALQVIGQEVRDRDFRLWVDAVCINFDDLVERISQLVLMPTIYSKAVLVAIWLGEASEDTPGAIEQMNELANHLASSKAGNVGLPTGDTLASYISPHDAICSTAARSQAIWNILNRQWFSRTWIALEVTGTQVTQKRIFWCGDECVTWETLAATSAIAHKLVHSDVTKLDPFAILDKITKWRKENNTTRCQILNLLGELRLYDCTNPRDKIYAVAGLASDLSLTNLWPNYALSVERVYIDFAATSLSKAPADHWLDFLGHVIRESPDFKIGTPDTLPSWVPDWRTKRSIHPFHKYRINIQTDGIQSPAYHASRGIQFKGSINGNHLHVEGLIISRISYLSPPSLVTETSKPEAYYSLVNFWSQAKQDTIVDKVFLNTMIANTIDVSDTTFPIRTDDFDWNAKGTIESMRKATYGRRLIWTDLGKLGLAPAAARVGDKICLFFGGQVLYVMRRREKCCRGEWEFVGECYVCDMMDGDGLLGWNNQGYRFVIA